VKRLSASIVFGAIAVAPLACSRSPEGGTPGTANSFVLVAGSVPSAIKQGDAQSVKVTVERGKDFHKSVRLQAKGPEKIHATLDRNLVKEDGPPDVNVRIHPNEDAAPGDYKVTVTASTDDGDPTNLELAVRVIQK